MKRLITLLLLAVVSVSVSAKPEIKGSPDELRQFLHPVDRLVSLYAEAEETAYSDKAIVSLVITTEDKLLANSIAGNSELRASIAKTLMAAGIPGDEIKNSKFSTSPQYGWFGKKPDSYKVVNRMAVSITDEAQMKAIASVADNNKEVELSGTVFEHTEKDEYKNKVKQQALEKVMQQKKFYEASLGIKLTPVAFRDANIAFRATAGARMLEQSIVTAKTSVSGLQSMAGTDSARQASSFDEVQYQAGIYVDFKIEPGTD